RLASLVRRLTDHPPGVGQIFPRLSALHKHLSHGYFDLLAALCGPHFRLLVVIVWVFVASRSPFALQTGLDLHPGSAPSAFDGIENHGQTFDIVPDIRFWHGPF